MSKPRGKSNTKSRERGGKEKMEDDTKKKSNALAFNVLSKEDSEELVTLSALGMESKLLEILQLNPLTDLKDAAILDYYVGAMYWAKQQEFNAQQLSGLFSVIYILLNKIKEQEMSLVDALKELCKLLVGIGAELTAELESGGIEFFSVKQAKAVTDYMYNSIFQHYKLYEFMFNMSQAEEIIGSDLSVQVPLPATTPFPPPLDEGISEEVFNEFLSIPTPSLSTESTSDLKAEEETKPLTPIEIDLPPEAADLFNKLTSEDVRNIVDEVAAEMLNNLQIGVENKFKNQENAMLTKINKIHNVLPEPQEAPGN